MEMESTTDQPNWLELPRDVTTNILQRLTTIEIVTSACQVCPLWWNICKDPLMWRTIHMTKLRHSCYNHGDNLVKICRYAVAQSCSLLEDIEIEYFGTDDLLAFIADCAGKLSCLGLVACGGLSDKRFSEAVKKLPLLEKLDISFSSNLSKDSIEVVGRHCPLLKSLKYGGIVVDNMGNDVSFAIAKTMPGLHHLKISGDMPTDDGLLAILDGCPQLESFDLRGCCCFQFSESLKEKCREQIKDFRLPLQISSASNWDILSENSNLSSYLDCYFNA